MERLRLGQLRGLSKFLEGLYAARDLPGFVRYIVKYLPQLVPSDLTAYGEVVPARRRFQITEYPWDAVSPAARETFLAYSHEHPFTCRYRGGGDGGAVMISDLLALRQFRELGVYQEFFRRVGIDREMVVWLPAPRPLEVTVAVHRKGRDFSEGDRLLLNLLRPHLVQAYRNAEAFTLLQKAATRGREPFLFLTPDLRVTHATPGSQELLATYFGGLVANQRLPDVLERWIRQEETRLRQADDAPPPVTPLIVEREDRSLIARLLIGPTQRLVLFEERSSRVPSVPLERLGLTRREAEVLAWVAEGKKNEEIATILAISPRTVAHHVESILRKLGIETRTAAVARALTVVGPRFE